MSIPHSESHRQSLSHAPVTKDIKRHSAMKAKWLYKWRPADILGSAGRHQRKAMLPSWVPDWRYQLEVSRPYHMEWSAGGTPNKAPWIRFLSLPKPSPTAGNMPCYSYVDGNGRTKMIPGEGLELTAVLQDRIVYIGSDRNWQSERISENLPQHHARLAADLQYLEEYEPRYFTGEQAVHAYAATLIMNTTHEEELARPEYERKGFAEYQRWLEDGVPDPDTVCFDAISRFALDTSFCVTAHGLMACAPNLVQVGDYIAILSGFRDPFVLRKVGPEDGRYYELLEVCYVHRLMRTRAWCLIEDFKCKYQPGSEDETSDFASLEAQPDGAAESRKPAIASPSIRKRTTSVSSRFSVNDVSSLCSASWYPCTLRHCDEEPALVDWGDLTVVAPSPPR